MKRGAAGRLSRASARSRETGESACEILPLIGNEDVGLAGSLVARPGGLFARFLCKRAISREAFQRARMAEFSHWSDRPSRSGSIVSYRDATMGAVALARRSATQAIGFSASWREIQMYGARVERRISRSRLSST